MDLGTRAIQALATRYEEIAADSEEYFDKEERSLETLPKDFRTGDWTIDDLEWILQWKLVAFPWDEQQIQEFRRENGDSEIRSVVNDAIEAPSELEAVESLRSLHGVGVPMASAILLFVNPERYPVLDKHAWETLREIGYLEHDLSDEPSVEEYLSYVEVCRTLATEYEVGLRTLDRALWVIGKH
jgi:thermostable 8-oxoguanine DNA glycosylase